MRTTVTVDDDLFRTLERQAKKTDRPMREVINAAIRAGLALQRGRGKRPHRQRVKVFDCRLQPGIDPRRLNQAADDLAIDDALEILRRPA